MTGEIKNRVADSKLITLDLEDFYPSGKRLEVDISQFLFQGIILKEKEFRLKIKAYNWKQYQHCYIAFRQCLHLTFQSRVMTAKVPNRCLS